MWSDNIQPPRRPMNLHGILQDFVIGLSCEGHPGIFLVAGTSSVRCRGSVLPAGTAPLCATRGKVLTAVRTHVSAGHLTEKKATAQKSKDGAKNTRPSARVLIAGHISGLHAAAKHAGHLSTSLLSVGREETHTCLCLIIRVMKSCRNLIGIGREAAEGNTNL